MKSLLIVESDPFLLKFFEAAIKPLNFKIFLATSADEGAKIYFNEECDLVICDQGEAQSNDMAFIKNLRSGRAGRKKTSPIILVTNDLNLLRPNLSFEEGITYLGRPFTQKSVEEIVMSISHNLEQGQGQEQDVLEETSSRDRNTGNRIQIKKGTFLLREGDEEKSMYYLLAGQCQAFKEVAGKKIILGDIYKGEVIGEISFFDEKPRSASVIATEDCELLKIPIDRFVNLMQKEPPFIKILLKTLCLRLRSAGLKIKI